MFSPELLVVLKPFGILGLIVLAIVAIVSLVGNLSRARVPIAMIIALVVLAGLASLLIVVSMYRPTVFWGNVAQLADWGGDDADCSDTLVPEADYCNDQRIGQIAVCWQNRNEGWPPGDRFNRCRNKTTWCTYKDETVRVGRAATGHAPPGRVYICAAAVSPG